MLFAVIGNLGAGKTATLTFLAKHFSNLGYSIFANYLLTDIDYKHVVTVQDLDHIRKGFFFGDELWLWLDSRVSSFDEFNKKISDILIRSRKRGYNIGYSAQGLYQVDKRIRKITDYILLTELLYYDPDTGTLSVIEQNFLYPIDLKPYLDNLVVNVKVCTIIDSDTLLKQDEFSYWLKDVAESYDTAEEITDIRSNVHKGIHIENRFRMALKEVFEGALITQSTNSGHYQNTLDIEMLYNNNLYLFDVCTITKRKVYLYEYFYLDNREKKLSKIKDIGKIRNAYVYFAFNFDKEWYLVRVHEDSNFKEMTNLKDLRGLMIKLSDFKNELDTGISKGVYMAGYPELTGNDKAEAEKIAGILEKEGYTIEHR